MRPIWRKQRLIEEMRDVTKKNRGPFSQEPKDLEQSALVRATGGSARARLRLRYGGQDD